MKDAKISVLTIIIIFVICFSIGYTIDASLCLLWPYYKTIANSFYYVISMFSIGFITMINVLTSLSLDRKEGVEK